MNLRLSPMAKLRAAVWLGLLWSGWPPAMCPAAGGPAPPPGTIIIRAEDSGACFEGIGALSAGASSRLLREYPEPQRRQVLDYLFRPNFGAALQHLKVEVGGDVNSTDGVEPSHMHTRDDENYQRGYEWWLMKEARRRNPGILLDALSWGAPGWIGNGRFYSEDMAEYLSKFLTGARRVHGLEVAYVGIWNETPHDPEWIKLLRRTLDRKGLTAVKIVAADSVGTNRWLIAEQMKADPELRRAVAVIGEHYPEYRSPAAAHTLGKPVWSSEDGPWRGDWEGAAKLARMFNRNYAIGRMTKTIIWSPVTSYYDTLPLPGSGLMRANEPWTGHYAVQPAIWIVAHTTQFAQPGWQYLDGACREIPGGSIVALRSPNRRDFSVIIETMDATNRQTLRLAVEGFPPARPVYLWRSDARAQFEALGEIKPDGGGFTLALEPNTAYSLTTTRGQQRGEYGRVPASQPFPLPHRDHFERYAAGAMPRYFSDQAGVWEVVRRADGRGKALRQVLPQKGIEWHFHKDPTPQTFLGDPSWRDYEVRADVRLEAAGFACLYGRVSLIPQRPEPPGGYCLKVQHDGRWELLAPIQKRGDKPGENKSANLDGPPLAQGRVPFNLNAWHALQLRMAGPEISVVIDGQQVAVVQDATHAAGQAGVGSGWQAVEFDNFQALPVSAKP